MKNQKLEEFVNRLGMELKLKPSFETTNIEGEYFLNGKEKSYTKNGVYLGRIQHLKWYVSFIESDDSSIELFMIKVNKNYRGNGIGIDLINTILNISDELNISIKLIPYSFDTDSDEVQKCLDNLNSPNQVLKNYNRYK